MPDFLNVEDSSMRRVPWPDEDGPASFWPPYVDGRRASGCGQGLESDGHASVVVYGCRSWTRRASVSS